MSDKGKLSREEFLKICGGTAGMFILGKTVVFSQAKNETPPTKKEASLVPKEAPPAAKDTHTTGADRLPYVFVQEGVLKPGVEKARGIAMDGKDNLYVAGAKGVSVFNPSGKKIREIASLGPATCVALGGEGDVFIGQETRIEVFDAQGKPKASWGKEGKGPGELGYVTSLAVCDDFVYVADYGNRALHRFAATGDFVDSIPGFLIPSPFFDCVMGPDKVLYLGNTGRHRVERYDANGKLLGFWGKQGLAPEDFCGCCNPTNLAIFPDGRVVTAEKGIPRLKMYNSKGKLLACLGPEAFPEDAKGMDLAIDSKGRIALLEPVSGQVRFYILKKT
jgi:sugar lactone lactonase YvrE